jgi:putative tricarboxylic transport membrane protein
MAGILTGNSQILSTGLSKAIAMARASEARVIAFTSLNRLDDAPNMPTLAEQGYAIEFANWRGLFAAKDLPTSRYKEMQTTLRAVIDTPAFEVIRQRNSWTVLHEQGDEFYRFLEQQDLEIGKLMRQLGFLRP